MKAAILFSLPAIFAILASPPANAGIKCISKHCQKIAAANAQKSSKAEKRNFTELKNCQPHDEVKVMVSADKHAEKAKASLKAAEDQVPKLISSCESLKNALQGDETIPQFSADAQKLTELKKTAFLDYNTSKIELDRASSVVNGLAGSKHCYAEIKKNISEMGTRMKVLDGKQKNIESCSKSASISK